MSVRKCPFCGRASGGGCVPFEKKYGVGPHSDSPLEITLPRSEWTCRWARIGYGDPDPLVVAMLKVKMEDDEHA